MSKVRADPTDLQVRGGEVDPTQNSRAWKSQLLQCVEQESMCKIHEHELSKDTMCGRRARYVRRQTDRERAHVLWLDLSIAVPSGLINPDSIALVEPWRGPSLLWEI
jgi:hypothetical protein